MQTRLGEAMKVVEQVQSENRALLSEHPSPSSATSREESLSRLLVDSQAEYNRLIASQNLALKEKDEEIRRLKAELYKSKLVIEDQAHQLARSAAQIDVLQTALSTEAVVRHGGPSPMRTSPPRAPVSSTDAAVPFAVPYVVPPVEEAVMVEAEEEAEAPAVVYSRELVVISAIIPIMATLTRVERSLPKIVAAEAEAAAAEVGGAGVAAVVVAEQ